MGKTAVAEGLAQLLAGMGPAASGINIALPPGLQGRRMVALDVGSLVAGTQYRGALEERLQVGRHAGGRQGVGGLLAGRVKETARLHCCWYKDVLARVTPVAEWANAGGIGAQP